MILKKNKNIKILREKSSINIDIDMKLILWVIKINNRNINSNNPIFKYPLNWERILLKARNHGIILLLYKKLKNLKQQVAPSEIMTSLESFYNNNTIRNLRMAQKLIRLIKLLSTEKIDAIAFKGACLAIRAYKDLSVRTFGDLDIYIRKKDFVRVYDLLELYGYKSSFLRIKKMKNLWKRTGRDFVFLDKSIAYDFHQRITQGSKQFRIKEEIWKNSSFITLNSCKVKVLSSEDTVLALSIHGAKHNWLHLKFITDIAFFISSNKGLDWSLIISKAKNIGCLNITLAGILLSNEFCGLLPPLEINKEINKNKRVKKLTNNIKTRILRGKTNSGRLSEFLCIPRTMDSIFDGLRYIFYYIFTPSQFDLLYINLPEFLYPFYYIIRPIRQFYKYLTKFLDLLFNEFKKSKSESQS